jgi:hypothetical protein
LGCFAHYGVDEIGQLAAAPAVHDPHEIAEKRRVGPLAALVRCDARELEQLVHLGLREIELGSVATGRRDEPVARLCEPVVHSGSLVSAPQ